MPVVAFVNGGTANTSARPVAAFRRGLSETGYVEGQNVLVEYHWLEGHHERLQGVMTDLVRRRVAVIATPGFPPGAVAAKAATATVPIVFGVGTDPVKFQAPTPCLSNATCSSLVMECPLKLPEGC
jgi:ABC-type uncharacterized transport system substrate-binding protein